jgi:hypothetical protein
MRNLKFLVAFALLCLFVSAIGPANAGVANPPNIPVPTNPAGWCTATALVPGTVRTTQIGDCPAPPPDTCPAGRLTSAYIAVQSYTGGNRRLMDVTQADNLFGYYSWSTGRLSYPWKNDYTVFEFPRAPAYIAGKFVVPLNSIPAQWGTFRNLETLPGPGIDFAISPRCGDFSPAAQYCAADNVYGGRALVADKLPGYPGIALCKLTPGATYYVNIRLHNPAAGGANCTSVLCKFGIQRNHTP